MARLVLHRDREIFRHPHRMTRAQRAAVDAMYNPRTNREYNNAFTHSAQCDAYMSLTPACAFAFTSLANVPGDTYARYRTGELQRAHFQRAPITFKHDDCSCWCHWGGGGLDEDTPPDYVVTQASGLDLIANQEYSSDAPTTEPSPFPEGYGMEVVTPNARCKVKPVVQTEPLPVEPPQGMIDPLCELCDEPLSVCECVEFIDDKPYTQREKAALYASQETKNTPV